MKMRGTLISLQSFYKQIYLLDIIVYYDIFNLFWYWIIYSDLNKNLFEILSQQKKRKNKLILLKMSKVLQPEKSKKQFPFNISNLLSQETSTNNDTSDSENVSRELVATENGAVSSSLSTKSSQEPESDGDDLSIGDEDEGEGYSDDEEISVNDDEQSVAASKHNHEKLEISKIYNSKFKSFLPRLLSIT